MKYLYKILDKMSDKEVVYVIENDSTLWVRKKERHLA